MDTVNNLPKKVRKTRNMSKNAKEKSRKNAIILVKNNCKMYQNKVTSFQNLQNSGNSLETVPHCVETGGF